MKISSIFFYFLIILSFYSCENRYPKSDDFEKKHIVKDEYFQQKMKIIEKLGSNNNYLSKTGSEYEKEFNRTEQIIYKMRDLLEETYNRRESTVDFSKFKGFFKTQKFYKTDFWTKNKMSIEEGILLIENLYIEIGRSELCNDLYVHEDLQIVCEEKEPGVLTISTKVDNPGWKKMYVLSTKDSLKNRDAMKKKIVEGTTIKRKSNEKYVEGGVLVRKFNSQDLKYFKYYWK
ncbi:MAG: hypothetical protein ACK479_13925 [Fluviicola sp.]|jgi:hypothetical protein